MEEKIRDVIRGCLISPESKIKFFGDIAMLFNYIADDTIPTAGVASDKNGKIAFYYNPKYIESLSYKQLTYLVMHEISHIALNHLKRVEEFKDYSIDKNIHNIAADMAVNSLLGEPPEKDWIYPTMYNLPIGLSYERYLKELLDKISNDNVTNSKNGKNNNNNNGDKENNSGSKFEKHSDMDVHDKWDEIKDNLEYEKIRNQIKEIFERYKGSLSDDLEEAITSSYKKVINWKIRVRNVVHGYFKDYKFEPDYGKQNRRYPQYFGLIPGKRKKYKGKLMIFIDTSGSMSTSEIKSAFDLALSLPYDKEIYMIDTEIKGKPIKILGQRPKLKVNVKGRGGTDFRPAFKLADEKKALCVLYFTDLCGNFPNYTPKYDVYWVQFGNEDIKPPFGKIIKVNEILEV